jgi:RND family efflux transporter MFP subunit
MLRRLVFSFAPLLCLLFSVLAGGCGSPAGPGSIQVAPTIVSVAKLEEREVLDYSEFTGRTAAVESVEIKARATGYLEEVMFKEGDELKKGDQLYRIDDRTYKAEVARIQGEITRQQATLTRLNADLARARRLRIGDTISREEYDKISTSKDEAQASLASAKESLKRAELNLEFTHVLAPIDGKVGRTRITKGNLVTSDQTLLTTILSIDPIYAYFDIDERSVLRTQRQIREKKLKSYREAKFPVLLGTQLEKGHPHEGYIDFVDNTMDPSTATLRVRGRFDNKERILSPGLFVRIRLPLGDKRKTLVVSERALGTDQGQRFLYVVNDKNEVEQRTVEVGALRDGLRIIESGVKAGEWVIVSGLQRVREGVKVEPKQVAMPVPGTN